MNTVLEKIEAFNENNQPFSISYYENGKYGKYELGVRLNFLNGKYKNYGRNAFNNYAKKMGEPIKEDGLYTHGNGHEWKEVFNYYFSKEEALSRIKFDCEAGGFYCTSDDLDLLVDFGQRFRGLCENEQEFENVVIDALTAKYEDEINCKETMSMGGM